MLSKLHFTLSTNVKYGILFVGSLIFCVGIYIYAIAPIVRDRIEMTNKLAVANMQLAALQTFAGQNQDYAALQKIQNMKIAAAQKKIPDTVSVPELIGEYNKLSEQTQVSLLSVKPDKVTKGKTYISMPITVTVEGDYFRLITFLQQVDNGDRFVNLSSAKFAGSKLGTDVKMEARLIVYCLKNVVGAPAGQGKATHTEVKDAKGSIQRRDAQNRQALGSK